MTTSTYGVLVLAAAVGTAASDEQAQRVRELVSATGQPFEYRSFPNMGHNMHDEDPEGFAKILVEWESTLPD